MSRIPESFIADLLDRIDIVEVIGSRLQMKRAGREFHALCPFHDEKTPSFTVSPQKQFYHCFGCGAHGTAIGFTMEYDGLDFVDAIEELARSISLPVPREGAPAPKIDTDLFKVVAAADQFFRRQLKNSPAVPYLKNRGISGATAQEFGLGYAPKGWNGLMDYLRDQGFSKETMDNAGLLSGTEKGRAYDRFRDRLMFPINDRRGRPVAFGGRTLGSDDDGPKYLNSPETPLFHKGRQLYGLSNAMAACRHGGEVMVVEGYMDVIGLAQAGIRDAVATLGTATTSDHAELLFRTAPHVICCFDGDNAGRRAAWKAVEALLPRLREGRQASFLFLPQGEDPDSLVQNKGAEAFLALRQAATPLSDYFFDHFSDQVDLHSLDGRSRLVALARPALEKIPDGSFRDLMFERLQRTARMERQISRPPMERTRQSSAPARRTLVRSAISCLLAQPELAAKVENAGFLAQLDMPGVNLLLKLVDFLHERPNLKTGSVIELWDDRDEARHLVKLAASILLDEETDLAAELTDAIEALRKAHLKQRVTQLQEKQTRADLDAEEKHELMACLTELASAR
ncbi:MAG: DNA primase [Lysobacteraceae bacterium]|nr:MAG: DNA primase [Xanthomonadaceae bacterium]